MKKQTFIAQLETEDGKMNDFFRFSCARTSTVKKKMLAYWEEAWELHKNDNIHHCTIYATQTLEEKIPVETFGLKSVLEMRRDQLIGFCKFEEENIRKFSQVIAEKPEYAESNKKAVKRCEETLRHWKEEYKALFGEEIPA